MEHKIIPKPHVLLLPYPSQGHINPLYQFAKRLVSKGIKATIALTLSISNSIKLPSSTNIDFVTISDGYDEGGFAAAGSVQVYLERMEEVGTKTLTDVIIEYKNSQTPIDCIVYDPFLYWALDVAKRFGLCGAAFFTQNCSVNSVYHLVQLGLLKLPVSSSSVSIPGLPPLKLRDMPSYLYVPEQYPAYFKMLLNQFSNIDDADFVLVNTFHKLESEVVESYKSKFRCPLLTIGPTIPSFYLDKRIQNDEYYDLNLFRLSDSSIYTDWLNTKSKRSVIYVSFGSMANLSKQQMKELAMGLKQTNFHFLWVVKRSEEEKIPEGFVDQMGGQGLIVNWSLQLEVLANEAIGCFLTHAGWNSTIEGLSLGVPMVVMAQWTDQPMNAKLIEGVWEIGIRGRVKIEDEIEIVGRDEIEKCLREVMEGERGKELAKNAKKWRELAIEAVSEGGTSDKNIDEFISKLSGSTLDNGSFKSIQYISK